MKPNSIVTVANNLNTFGKPPRDHWSFDQSQVQPRSPVTGQPWNESKQDGIDRKAVKTMTNWIPKAEPQGDRAAGLRVHANKVGVDTKVKRIPFTIVNEQGDEERRFSRIIKNSVSIAFGKTDVVFTKTNRGLSFYDSRTPKIRRSKDFVLSELCRMIGEKAGSLAMEHLEAL